MQDVVALTEEINAIHKETSGPILLRPGQVGTILMSFDDRAYLVDFADAQGNTYAMETVPSEKLMGVADLRYERLNMQIIETSIHNASEFSTDFFHTLIKQRPNSRPLAKKIYVIIKGFELYLSHDCGTGILPCCLLFTGFLGVIK